MRIQPVFASVLLALAYVLLMGPLVHGGHASHWDWGEVEERVKRGQSRALTFADVLTSSKFALLLHPVHEEMTVAAVNNAGVLFQTPQNAKTPTFKLKESSLIQGVRWPDMPDTDVIKANLDESSIDNAANVVWALKVQQPPLRGIFPQGQHLDLSKVSLAQRSHYFDLQYWHAMVPCKLRNIFDKKSLYVNYRCEPKTNSEVRSLMVSQAVEWFIKASVNARIRESLGSRWADREARVKALARYRNGNRGSFASAYHEFARIFRKGVFTKKVNLLPTPFFAQLDNGIEDPEFYLGNILHMLEDSYSSAHCARLPGKSGRLQEGPIVYFQDYAAQSASRHAKSDEPTSMCHAAFTQYWRCGPSDLLRPVGLSKDRVPPANENCRKGFLRMYNECLAKNYGVSYETLVPPEARSDPLTPAELSSRISRILRNTWNVQDALNNGHGAMSAEPAPLDSNRVGPHGSDGNLVYNAPTSPTTERYARFFFNPPKWASIPGAMAGQKAARTVVKFYRDTFNARRRERIAGSIDKTSALGALRLMGFLLRGPLRLARPHTVAGGTMPVFGGEKCPDPETVMTNLNKYTRWDHSMPQLFKKLWNNRATRWIEQTYRRVFHMRQTRHPLQGLEVTCMAQCRRVMTVDRVAPACFNWNKRKGKYELKCCVDIELAKGAEIAAVAARAAPATDAIFLRNAMKGAGSHNRELIQLLTQRTHAQLGAIAKAYASKFKRSLIKDVEADVSGPYERVMLGLFKHKRDIPVDKYVATDAARLWRAIEGWGTNTNVLTDTLLKGTPKRNRAVAAAFANLPVNKRHTTLIDAILDDTSGWYPKALLSLFIDITGADVHLQTKGRTDMINIAVLRKQIRQDWFAARRKLAAQARTSRSS
eukprot:TRINITY_DN4272_c0_g2_i1.p1 TRINITY_DN4272_c0_g2~~TRINITY_DN4272_c0_g2_i1.p1  ORF type:complete len:880 (+),score=173.75 TRINITY_DN4272_c0_g2_i1:81-2720(+)